MNQFRVPQNDRLQPESALQSALVTAEPDPLRHLLLESRQRWRDMAMMTGDLAFETDAGGRFVFIAPETVFGWPSSTLLGQPADMLLAGSDFANLFNPFRPLAQIRRRRAWLRRPDGGTVCYIFAAGPLIAENGQIIGARGIGQDMTEQDGHDAANAVALRRGEVLDHILWCIRQEVLAPRMMQAALQAMVTAIGLEGAAVIDLKDEGLVPGVLHQTGQGLTAILHDALALLRSDRTEPEHTRSADGRVLLVCPCQTRFGERGGLAIWRAAGERGMDADDVILTSSAAGLVCVLLEHESIQREMARQARTDPLTGLLNRRAFLDEVTRRLERLEHERSPGTLMFIDLDNFKALNDLSGHDKGDEALRITAVLLRSVVRAHDLVARLGGDEFAVWLDGTDEFSAAERAEELRLKTPESLWHLSGSEGRALSMSIGIATRWPGRGEDVEALIQRADQVMYDVKRSGRGHWRVSRPPEA